MPERIVYESDARAVERDPRAQPREASVRTAEAPASAERLTRRRRVEDPLYFDQRIVPPGMSYEWKRQEVLGRPDKAHWIGLRENHWSPVPAARHRDLAVGDENEIRRGDVILCERPKYLTDEAKMEDMTEALKPVQGLDEIMYGTKPDQMTRDHPSVRRASFVKRTFAPGDPEDGLSSEP